MGHLRFAEAETREAAWLLQTEAKLLDKDVTGVLDGNMQTESVELLASFLDTYLHVKI